MKFAIIGDTHANAPWTKAAIIYALNRGADAIIQVGDFGFWPRQPTGESFLNAVNELLVSRDVTLFFCDGNHEDHEMLNQLDTTTPQNLASNVVWMPRASVLEVPSRPFDGRPIRFMFFGGAVSVDKDHRTPGISWFASEVPSPLDWENAYNAQDIDAIISHEAPAGGFEYPSSGVWPSHLTHASALLRAEILDLGQALKPTRWYAGHHHRFIEWDVTWQDGTRCAATVLGCDGDKLDHAVAFLDTETFFDPPIVPPPA